MCRLVLCATDNVWRNRDELKYRLHLKQEEQIYIYIYIYILISKEEEQSRYFRIFCGKFC
jgi:hypothetical protein